MKLSELNQSINELIGEARSDEALQTLLQYLADKPKLQAFERVARNLQALWQQTKQRETSGLITMETAQVSYNRVNDGMLRLVDQLERGLDNPAGFGQDLSGKKKTPVGYWIAGVLLLLIAAGTAYFFLQPEEEITCPGFPEESKLNILLLPFKNLAEGGLRPEITIKDRLDKLSDQQSLNTFSNIFDRYYDQENAQFPDFDLARNIGAGCSAGLIVWGTAERLPNRIVMNAKFSFTGEAEFFNLNKVQLEGETQIDTIQSVSSIAREGNLTRDIESLILTLFGLIAHESGDYDAAVRALANNTRSGDTSLISNMLLADSYLAMGDKQRALESFDKVLEVHPDYALALNNRGLLLYEQGQYERATEDFSQILELQPENTEALVARGAAYAKMDKIRQAEKDIEKAKRIDPEVRVIEIPNLTPDFRRRIELEEKNY